MRLVNGSQARRWIRVPAMLLNSAAILLSSAGLSVAFDRVDQNLMSNQDVGPQQLLYTILVVEVPADGAKVLIENWNLLGASMRTSQKNESGKSRDNAIFPASFTTSPATTTVSEFRTSEELSDEQINELVGLGKVVASQRLVGEDGAEVNLRVGRDLEFLAAYENVRDESGNESAAMKPVFATILDGIHLGLTGVFDENKDHVQFRLRFNDSQFKEMGSPFIFESTDGPLEIQQPVFESKEIQTFFKARSEQTIAFSSGPTTRESVVEQGVPLIGRIPHVGKFFRFTSKSSESFVTVILFRCQELDAVTP